MKKIQEAIYFNRLDLNQLFWAKDKKGLGYISAQDFTNGLKLAPVTWNAGELEEILKSAPKDPANNVYYKDFQKNLSKERIQSTIVKPEQETWVYEKVATALNEYVLQVRNNVLSFDDFRVIIRKTWLNIPVEQLREIWDVLPHDKFTLAGWAKSHAVKITSFEVPESSLALETLPVLMVRLKEVALLYGNRFLVASLKSKDWMSSEELIRVLERFRVMKGKEEFNEFREWAVEKRLMKVVGKELFCNGPVLSLYFSGVDFVEGVKFDREVPVMHQVVQNMYFGIVRDKLRNIRQNLEPYIKNDYVEEINLRDVLKFLIPSLTNENISLFINSLQYTIPSSPSSPFRQINLPEFLSLFDPNQEITLPILPKPTQPLPPLPTPAENFHIQETFSVKPRDSTWEKSLIQKVFQVKNALLANFRINDWNHSGALTLEIFHFTLVKSLDWLCSEEINFLVELGLRECGSIDEARTELARRFPDRYRLEGSISSVWFPGGEQYNVSYLFFFVVLERLGRD